MTNHCSPNLQTTYLHQLSQFRPCSNPRPSVNSSLTLLNNKVIMGSLSLSLFLFLGDTVAEWLRRLPLKLLSVTNGRLLVHSQNDLFLQLWKLTTIPFSFPPIHHFFLSCFCLPIFSNLISFFRHFFRHCFIPSCQSHSLTHSLVSFFLTD